MKTKGKGKGPVQPVKTEPRTTTSNSKSRPRAPLALRYPSPPPPSPRYPWYWYLRLWVFVVIVMAVGSSAALHALHLHLASSGLPDREMVSDPLVLLASTRMWDGDVGFLGPREAQAQRRAPYQGHGTATATALTSAIPVAFPTGFGMNAWAGSLEGSDAISRGLVPRQATQPAPAAAPAPTPATPGRPVQETAPIPADPAILISIISEPSQSQTQSQNSANPNPTASSVNPTSSSPSSAALTTSSSSTTPTPTAPKPTPSIRLSLSTFIPALGGLTLLLLLIVAWLVYGCFTRKPKTTSKGKRGLDREELISGPPYNYGYTLEGERFLNSDGGAGRDRVQDFERVFGEGDLERGGRGRGRRGVGLHGYEDDQEAEHLLGRQQQQQQPRRKMNVSRWPSFNSPPTFDPSRGFYVPKRYEGGDHDGEEHEHARLMAVPPALSHTRTGATKSRSKSRSRTSHVTSSSRTGTSRTPQRPGWKSKYSSSSTVTAASNASRSSGAHAQKHTRTRPPPPTHNPSASTFSTQLYSDPESDEELLLQKQGGDVHEDKDKDPSAPLDAPWESLRHKSIKRGILEQVKKGKEREAKWMDSIRSGGAGILASLTGSMSMRGSRAGAGDGSRSRSRAGEGDEEGVEMLFDDGEGDGEDLQEALKAEGGTSTRKRRGHVRADSDLFVDPARPPSAAASSSKGGASTPTRRPTQPLNISKSSTPSPTKPGFRRGFSWLKGDAGQYQEEGEGEEGYELLPTPFEETRRMQWGQGQSRSATSSPVKGPDRQKARSRSRARSNTVDSVTGGGTMKTLPATPSRDVLPKGPSQIMSPPLESQMCFTPLALSIAQMPVAAPSNAEERDGAGLPSFGQVVGRGTGIPTAGEGSITAPVPARLGSSKSRPESRSRSHSQSRTDHDAVESDAPTKLPLPSRRLRFPVTQASPARPAAATASAASTSASFNLDNEDYVEVGNFAPFRTPSPKKLKKGKDSEASSRSRSRSGDGGEGTPVKERESFWTPRKKK